MNRVEHLFEAIGLVNDDYIEEAADARAVRTAAHWQRWGTLAATLVLVAGLGMAATTQLRGCGAKTSNLSTDTAAPESTCTQDTVTTDSATGSSAAMEESAEAEDSADGGVTTDSAADSNGLLLPSAEAAVELTPLLLPEGDWTVARQTTVTATAAEITVDEVYTVTNDGNSPQSLGQETVAPGETVDCTQSETASGGVYALLPVEGITAAQWTVEVVNADNAVITGLTSGELAWECHVFTVSQP